MVVRSCTDERLLARSETEGARRPRPRHSQKGGGFYLRSLDAHHREVSEAKEGGRGVGPGKLPGRTPSICTSVEERRMLWAQLEENSEATLERHCELWEQKRRVRVSVATMSRAIRHKLGWT